MRKKPLVLEDGKINQLQTGQRLSIDQFSYHTVIDEVTIFENQSMLVTQVQVEDGGFLNIEGTLEVI